MKVKGYMYLQMKNPVGMLAMPDSSDLYTEPVRQVDFPG
jgi:hypothetical protein